SHFHKPSGLVISAICAEILEGRMIGQTMPCHTSSVARKCCKSIPRPLNKTHNLKSSKALANGLAFMLLLLTGTMVSSQAVSTGTVIGTVTDQQGAVVPDATVSLVDKSTNAEIKTTSNSAGHYAFPHVNSGTYDIRVTKQGFQTAIIPNQTVQIASALTEDIKLTVGSVTQEITVETTGTELQTLNATVGNTVSTIALSSLPSLGRDVSTFATLQPAVSPDGSVAGTAVDNSSFQLDGGNNTNDMDGSMSVYTPTFAGDPTGGVSNQSSGVAAGPTGVIPTPADSVEEFKVNTANQ